MSRDLHVYLLAGFLVAGCGEKLTPGDGVDTTDTVEDVADTAGEEPGSDAECPPPGEVAVSLGLEPHMGEGLYDETGSVTAIDETDPERATFTVHFPDIVGHAPDQTYSVPMRSGDGVDLTVGDEVHVRLEKDLWDEWMQTSLHVARGGVTVLFHVDCMHHCPFVDIRTTPLEVETLSGACTPEEDPMGCVMLERRGYRVSCPTTSESVDVFDHGSGTVACGGDYLVMVGSHTYVTEDLLGCTGVVDDRIEAVFLRLR